MTHETRESKESQEAQSTQESQSTREARREAFRTYASKIARMTPEEQKELASRMNATTIEGHPLSIHNACLLAFQRPNATIVGGFRQWLKAGRVVRKGEHGAYIWVPVKRKSENGEADPEKVRFVVTTVFDVSQTEAL